MEKMGNKEKWYYCKNTTEFIFQKLVRKKSVYKTIDEILKKDGTKNTKCFEKYKGIDFDEFVKTWCKNKETMKSVDLIIGVNKKENKNKDKKPVLLIENKHEVCSSEQMKKNFSDLAKKYESSKNILSEYDIDSKKKLVLLAGNESKREKWHRRHQASTQKVQLEISTAETFYKNYFSSSHAL